MYARATVVSGDPARLDETIAYVRDRVLPVQRELPGSLGLSLNVDREHGRCTLTSMWRDSGSMYASAPELDLLRERAGELLGGQPATEDYEVAVLHRLRQAEPGNWVRSTGLQLDPAQVAAGIKAFRHQTLPEVERLPGFRSTTLMVNRRTGVGVVSVVFDDRATLEASRDAAGQVRRAASRDTGAAVTRVVEGEIVVAGLKLPLQEAAPVP